MFNLWLIYVVVLNALRDYLPLNDLNCIIDLDQKLLCDGSMTTYVKNWMSCMVVYKRDSFGSESRNTITRVSHKTSCTVFT